jgi:predicted deacylase
MKSIRIGETQVEPGQRCNTQLDATESYSGVPVRIPVSVWRAREPGPTVFVTAAVHGDELNGTGVVRELLLSTPFELSAGSLILVPVVNVLALDRHQRYLPDRRDLNRSFPGSPDGSLARRFAHAIFQAIVTQSDYGIDLHTAAVRRTNYPNVRADLRQPKVKRLAFSLGSEVVINGKGPKGSLRREACAAGCPTILFEAGEVWKIEPSVAEFGVRGVRNLLIELGMVDGTPSVPAYQVRVDKTKWIRAEKGGILQFHVAPGEVVDKGQALATSSDLHGRERSLICSPEAGIIIGMTTLPAVTPGDPICHLAIPPRQSLESIRRARALSSDADLDERVRDELSTSVSVTEPRTGSHCEPRT